MEQSPEIPRYGVIAPYTEYWKSFGIPVNASVDGKVINPGTSLVDAFQPVIDPDTRYDCVHAFVYFDGPSGRSLLLTGNRKGIFNLPGGKNEAADATPTGTLVREIAEELGLTASVPDLVPVGSFRIGESPMALYAVNLNTLRMREPVPASLDVSAIAVTPVSSLSLQNASGDMRRATDAFMRGMTQAQGTAI